jgi:hypothetical protein
MNGWRVVTEAEPWLVGSADKSIAVPAHQSFSPTRQFETAFPLLTTLLSHARLWEVSLPKGTQLLFAWGGKAPNVRAWLSPLVATVPDKAAPDHQILLGCFGGISERFNEPARNWLLNHNQMLIASEVDRDASFLTDYLWAFEECGGIPIDVKEYYPVAWEANGNCVLCSHDSGELLFFAPDHCDKNLLPYAQCPMYSLHVHRQAAKISEWIEHIADQWLRDIASTE